MCLGENLEGKREIICLGKCFKTTFILFFFFEIWGSWGIYNGIVTLRTTGD